MMFKRGNCYMISKVTEDTARVVKVLTKPLPIEDAVQELIRIRQEDDEEWKEQVRKEGKMKLLEDILKDATPEEREKILKERQEKFIEPLMEMLKKGGSGEKN